MSYHFPSHNTPITGQNIQVHKMQAINVIKLKQNNFKEIIIILTTLKNN